MALLGPNPFAQSPRYWKVVFTVHADAAGTAEESFGDMALAVSGFETDEKNKQWTFELLCGSPPDMEEVKRRLVLISALHNVPQPEPKVEEVQQQDWLSLVARDFPPLSIGRFYVHGTHVTTAPPRGSIPIKVDAGAAFGSGEHGTTGACLAALNWLARKRDFSNVLDMGCGSGILAIAASKLWRCEVLAADIDPVAVRVTQENIRANRVSKYVATAVSDGYASERIKRSAPYDLIISNILAKPLVAFAPSLRENLAPGGIAILSGLLDSQEALVRRAHQLQGLTFVRRFPDRGWHTLVVARKG